MQNHLQKNNMGFALLSKHQIRQLLRQRVHLLCKYLKCMKWGKYKGKSFGDDFQLGGSPSLWQGWGETRECALWFCWQKLAHLGG